MSGKAADWLGMAIASYEWMAAITLVVVAFLFLPTFLKSGIYTIPEFLEYRYNPFARTVMAISTLVILVGVPTASVIYSGAKVITVNFQGQALFGLDLGSITVGCWIIGVPRGGLRVRRRAQGVRVGRPDPGNGTDRRRRHHRLPGDEGPGSCRPGCLAGTARHRWTQRSWRTPVPSSGSGCSTRRLADRQAAHGPAGRRPGGPLDGAGGRAVDPELLLLGAQPVHHAAHPGVQVARRGPARGRVRGVPQAADPVRGGDPRHPRLQPVHLGPGVRRRRQERQGDRHLRSRPVPPPLRRGQARPERAALRQRHQGHQPPAGSRPGQASPTAPCCSGSARRSPSGHRRRRRAHHGLQRGAAGCRVAARDDRPARRPRRQHGPAPSHERGSASWGGP